MVTCIKYVLQNSNQLVSVFPEFKEPMENFKKGWDLIKIFMIKAGIHREWMMNHQQNYHYQNYRGRGQNYQNHRARGTQNNRGRTRGRGFRTRGRGTRGQ
jgi:hypothetical protein